jgi:hypothetical protein
MRRCARWPTPGGGVREFLDGFWDEKLQTLKREVERG